MKSALSLSLFILSLCLISFAGENGLFELKYVVIDPGHGGNDPGCVNRWGAREKEINLKVALLLKEVIRKEGIYQVYLTREEDRKLSLSERAEMANRFPADRTFFISLHCNSSPNGKGEGVETYVFDLEASDKFAEQVAARENAEENLDPLKFILNDLRHRSCAPYNELAARSVQNSLVQTLRAGDRRVRKAPLKVLADVKMPAILIEMGFLSNRREQRRLRTPSYQKLIAEAIYAGIKEFARKAGTF
ncbi:TPA: N-acetylmuramoyl-L-alanine amidase [Candidatus Poribacteria bacterium]|nr:N-acetylmuramoyl-L-alanine amidase [Candidatus Poribacteria bacterium]